MSPLIIDRGNTIRFASTHSQVTKAPISSAQECVQEMYERHYNTMATRVSDRSVCVSEILRHVQHLCQAIDPQKNSQGIQRTRKIIATVYNFMYMYLYMYSVYIIDNIVVVVPDTVGTRCMVECPQCLGLQLVCSLLPSGSIAPPPQHHHPSPG